MSGRVSALPKRPELPPGWSIVPGIGEWDLRYEREWVGTREHLADAADTTWTESQGNEWVAYADALAAELAKLRARLDRLRDGLHACEDAKDLYDLAYEAILGYEKEPTP